MKYFFYIFSFLIVGCSSPGPTESILTIDIEEAFDHPKDVLLSDLTDEIEYIPLETTPQSVTGEYLRVFATDKYIVAISFRHNHLFDRRTGKFIREIGHYGEGPNDYMATNVYLAFDENRETIQTLTFKWNTLEYDLDGNVVRTIYSPPDEKYHDVYPLEENFFVAYVKNRTGNDPDKLAVFDSKGKICNKFPNYHTFKADGNKSSFAGRVFYTWKNDVFFYEACVDTLFKVTKNDITPYYHFNLGKYNPPYSEKQNLPWPWEKPMRENFFDFDQINESEHFIFFSFWYQHNPLIKEYRASCHYFGYYKKKTAQTYIAGLDSTNNSPVINDLDGFAPLHPFLWNINQAGEMVAYIEAGDIAEWFEENPEKAKKLPDHLKKLSKLTPEDNPVAVIAKLK